MMSADVVVVGAGPSGLCFAQMFAHNGLRVTVLEKQAEESLAAPAFDGREIAITQRSAKILREAQIWSHLNPEAVSSLRDARVMNGSAGNEMLIEHRFTNQNELGYLISNHLIREAAYKAVKSSETINLMTQVEIDHVHTDSQAASVTLKNGQVITAKLLVAADSRFSEIRRMMGISAKLHDFGKTMMVCVMEHEVEHAHVAWEWFDYGQTLALLPMNGNRSSVVVTLQPQAIKHLVALDEAAFNQEMEQRFKHRLGRMQLASTRHAYPLVTAYANRFVAKRFALVGDAAVGMHPVTAHGFNFALSGADCLAKLMIKAHQQGADIASDALLARFEKAHRRATGPLFVATHAVAKIYSDDSLPATIVRNLGLRIGNRVKPFRRAVANMLTQLD